MAEVGLTYAPWVAREGMAGTYAHLVKAWGRPDEDWPNAAVREQVCERGLLVPVTADRYAPTGGDVVAEVAQNEKREWDVSGLRWRSQVEFLREIADAGEAARSFAGREKLVVMLLREAADALEHPNYRYQAIGEEPV